jgi:pimeloyl-ACP methyl ester carboxylesterase
LSAPDRRPRALDGFGRYREETEIVIFRGKTFERTARRLLLVLAFALAPASSQAAMHRPAIAALPCTSATPTCAEWVPLGKGQARARIYRTFPLDKRNPAIKHALIMIHGTLRNGDHYFTTATGAAFFAHALHDTIVIAPSLRSADPDCEDKLELNEISWSCSGNSWRSGGNATSDPDLTSFDFLDRIMVELADKKIFPNLQTIVLAGHSAGGQFVARYAMANRIDETLGVPISYLVANPSSYAWPDATRPLPLGDAAPDAAAAGWNEEAPHVGFRFGPFDPAKDPSFNQWPYGLDGRTGGYAARVGDAQLKKQLASRNITVLLGQVDTLPLGGFDDSPGAMAQGPTRRARGEAFVKYIDEWLGAKARVVIVPECGHNDRCIYTAEETLPLTFPGAR